MKKVAVLCLLLTCIMSIAACVDSRPRELFYHYANKYLIAAMEIVFTTDIRSDDMVNYTTVQKIEEIETCAEALCELPVDMDMLTPKAVRRVREQAYMFKITYKDGCWELVDAAGRFVVPSPDCGPINGQSYWHDGGPVAFQQAAFDALVQKFLSVPTAVDAAMNP